MESEGVEQELDALLVQLGELRDWCFDEDKEARVLRLRQTIVARLPEQDYLRRGQLLNCADQYDEEAERLLTKQVKLHPDCTEGWNQLGMCLWKKDSKELAHKCYLRSLVAGQNVHALQDLSMLLRQLIDPTSPEEYVLQSVDCAQQAIQLDGSNHKSW